MKGIAILSMLVVLAATSSCKKNPSSLKSSLNITGFYPVVVGTGESVTIFGSGFSADPTENDVRINGISVDVAFATANRLVVAIPSNAATGQISVFDGNLKVESKEALQIVTIIEGATRSLGTLTLSAKNKYLLRRQVIADKIIIPAGTLIFAEKESNASLKIASADIQGTQDNPVVFTSNQPVGKRSAGDWGGITVDKGGPPLFLATPVGRPFGTLRYVRVEFAGSASPGKKGAGLIFQQNSFQNIVENVQVSYSAGDAFRFQVNSSAQTPSLTSSGLEKISPFRYLVAFGCGGDDFSFIGSSDVSMQYLLSLKDPYQSNAYFPSTNVSVLSATNVRISNLTAVGYNPESRNVEGGQSLLRLLSRSTAAAFKVGGRAGAGLNLGNQGITLYVYNSLFVASLKGCFSLLDNLTAFTSANIDQVNGVGPWGTYESAATYPVRFRNNVIVGTKPFSVATGDDALSYGSVFSGSNDTSPLSNAIDVRQTQKFAFFCSVNDTTARLNIIEGQDDLSIKGLADYKMLNTPDLLPASGSRLLNRNPQELFPLGSEANIPQFNKQVNYIGAFGTSDWTKGWCDFNPTITVH